MAGGGLSGQCSTVLYQCTVPLVQWYITRYQRHGMQLCSCGLCLAREQATQRRVLREAETYDTGRVMVQRRGELSLGGGKGKCPTFGGVGEDLMRLRGVACLR